MNDETTGDYVKRLVESLPPLTEEQRAKLRVLLNPPKK